MAGNVGGYVAAAPSAAFSTITNSGAVQSGGLGANVVYSGNIASGQVGWAHHTSGQLLTTHIASGGFQSGALASGAVMGQAGGGFFHILSGSIATFDLGSGAIQSGRIASGQVGFGHLANAGVQSGTIASGVVFALHLASGGLQSGAVGSGTLAGFELASGAVVSGRIASGQVGFGHLANASVQSGTLASGSISTYAHASGAICTISQFVAPIYSGTNYTVLTAETVSGVRAVCFNQSGQVIVAMAAVSGRTPAMGVVIDNVLSGIQANVYTQGVIQFTSGLFTGIGYFSQPVWLGRSGHLCPMSGSFCSGGIGPTAFSGDIGQKLGTCMALGSGGVLLNVNTTDWSGGPLGESTGGVI